jgi:DNA end-binding protein Ku
MAPRNHWKGSVKLSFVTLPIALYPASTAMTTHFRSREAGCGYEQGESLEDARQQMQAA